MEIHNEVSPGWDEEMYHKALLQALQSKGIKAESKLRGYLRQRHLIADEFELDILVDNKIIIELKHVSAPFAPAHYLQMINYLKFWNRDLGLLINFGLDKLQYKRIPFTPTVGEISVCGPWTSYHENCAETAAELTSILQEVLNVHGLGYNSQVYKNLFKAECAYRGLAIDPPPVELLYDKTALGLGCMDAFCIHNHLLILITALEEDSSATDLKRMLGYLRHAELSYGVIINFGKTHLTLKLATC